MRKVILPSLAIISFILPCCAFAQEADASSTTQSDTAEPSQQASATETPAPKTTRKVAIDPFTGKITKSKVRLRLQPNYEGHVIRELENGEMLVVDGETDDFYAIKPPADAKAYVFRTFVLDNTIEGNRVNVRLKPDLDAPVVAQMSSGDKVDGTVNNAYPKWLEIKMPDSARFYVAKEYVQKVGDPHMLTRMEKRRDNVFHLLNTTEAMSQTEMQKPFDEINLEGIKVTYQRIMNDYPDVPDAVSKADQLLTSLQNQYTTKKIAYLESVAQQTHSNLANQSQQLNQELESHKSKIATLEQQIEISRQAVTYQSPAAGALSPVKPNSMPANMAAWVPVEENLFAGWSEQNDNNDPYAFYQDQMNRSTVIRGIIDPYTRPVKNKPGDYMLLSSNNRLPSAFLYSTQVNLQDYVGHEVNIRVVPRPNNHYAFPAYFVLSLE